MKPHPVVDGNGNKLLMKPVIKHNFPLVATCDLTKSMTYGLVRAKRCNPEVMHQQAVKECKGALSSFKYQPGDQVSLDQFVLSTPGR